jgi:1-hydroxycarotenoid 3,4-desaturase
MTKERVAIIGAGVGGLTAAIDLAKSGFDVTVLERAPTSGGKIRVGSTPTDAPRVDMGPTVFTMRHVFETLFADAGTSLDHYLTLRPLNILARHAWSHSEQLDLYANIEQSADAIGQFAGFKEAQGYRSFCARAKEIYQTLDATFIRTERPNVEALVHRVGLGGLGSFWRVNPFFSLWKTLGDNFKDPRLRQLFGRYATYCGSSPFLAPATLMLVAHVEQAGVWSVDGGMRRVAEALTDLATQLGTHFRYDTEATEILVANGRVSGVKIASGEQIAAEAVVVNADAAAVAEGLLGRAAASSLSRAEHRRSLSAMTWAGNAAPQGFPLSRHNVFFSTHYAAEFDAIFNQRRMPDEPTVYICAQDRDDMAMADPKGPERLLILINAPATGDTHSFDASEIEQCADRTLQKLRRCGLSLDLDPAQMVTTTPNDFAARFPATGGALYGQASHGWKASFNRPSTRTKIPGLYLAGGSTHPGPGVPMAAISGRLAAARVISTFASTGRSHRGAMLGGISTG